MGLTPSKIINMGKKIIPITPKYQVISKTLQLFFKERIVTNEIATQIEETKLNVYPNI